MTPHGWNFENDRFTHLFRFAHSMPIYALHGSKFSMISMKEN